jgi:hypothetical protein
MAIMSRSSSRRSLTQARKQALNNSGSSAANVYSSDKARQVRLRTAEKAVPLKLAVVAGSSLRDCVKHHQNGRPIVLCHSGQDRRFPVTGHEFIRRKDTSGAPIHDTCPYPSTRSSFRQLLQKQVKSLLGAEGNTTGAGPDRQTVGSIDRRV